MPIKFRKVSAKDSIFIKTREKLLKDYVYFQEYADNLTEQAGRAKDNKSGKGRSYANYLIRLVVFYQELSESEVNELLTFATLKEIEKVVNSEGFKRFNKNESHFPSAAFNCYISCITHINAEKEEKLDLQINNNIETSFDEDKSNNTSSIIERAQEREEMVITNGVSTYPRRIEESLEAKRRSNWQCELNSNHTTFISQANKKPYMESHHLIPMAAQGYFENTLDFADNIICLCPNCHRKIHHVTSQEKKEILKYLFKKREQRYLKFGINVNFKMLLNFYEII